MRSSLPMRQSVRRSRSEGSLTSVQRRRANVRRRGATRAKAGADRELRAATGVLDDAVFRDRIDAQFEHVATRAAAEGIPIERFGVSRLLELCIDLPSGSLAVSGL